MNTKNKLKIIFTFLLAIFIVLSSISFVFAGDVFDDGDAKTYQPDEFTTSGKIKTSGTGVNNVKSVGGQIVGLIQVVGTIAAVGMLIVLGIKYIMGSADERAEYKKTLFPYLIGAILIFAAANLTQVIYSWATNL